MPARYAMLLLDITLLMLPTLPFATMSLIAMQRRAATR